MKTQELILKIIDQAGGNVSLSEMEVLLNLAKSEGYDVIEKGFTTCIGHDKMVCYYSIRPMGTFARIREKFYVEFLDTGIRQVIDWIGIEHCKESGHNFKILPITSEGF